jgi:hypothetical protein
MTPYVMGALRLAASTYIADELSNQGFSIYTKFRPEVEGWGKQGVLSCAAILAECKHLVPHVVQNTPAVPIAVASTKNFANVSHMKIENRSHNDLDQEDEYDMALVNDPLLLDELTSSKIP